MKKVLLFLAVISFPLISFSQTVPLDSVSKYEGKTITVCSKVTGTHVSSGDKKNVSLNFGKPFPDNACSVYISESDLKNFKYDPSVFLKDKTICITGVVKVYKNKPEIVATKEEQIKVQK
jgi:hypothetical protein